MRWFGAYLIVGMFTTGIVAADAIRHDQEFTGDLIIASTLVWPVVWGVVASNAMEARDD